MKIYLSILELDSTHHSVLYSRLSMWCDTYQSPFLHALSSSSSSSSSCSFIPCSIIFSVTHAAFVHNVYFVLKWDKVAHTAGAVRSFRDVTDKRRTSEQRFYLTALVNFSVAWNLGEKIYIYTLNLPSYRIFFSSSCCFFSLPEIYTKIDFTKNKIKSIRKAYEEKRTKWQVNFSGYLTKKKTFFFELLYVFKSNTFKKNMKQIIFSIFIFTYFSSFRLAAFFYINWYFFYVDYYFLLRL